MKALVIDNEASLRQGLADLINLFCPDITETQMASGIKDGIEKILLYKPDILFLDVELDDGTGMDLLSKLDKINFQVVFVTAHNKYAVDAFRFSAIDFLLKPVNPEELVRSVERAKEGKLNTTLVQQIKMAGEEFKSPSAEKKIILKEQDLIHIVKVKDIIYCEAEGIYTTFFLNGPSMVIVSKNIKEYEDALSPFGFVRVHKSFLLNIDRVKQFEKVDGGFLILDTGAKIPVSQRKREMVLSLLKAL